MRFEKSFLKSKTLYVSLFAIVAGFFPAVQDLVSANPEIATTIMAVVFGLLRIKSDTPLVAKLPSTVQKDL